MSTTLSPTAPLHSISSTTTSTPNLWTEILESASRRGQRLSRKHVVVLGEPRHGKRTLIESLIRSSTSPNGKPPRSSLDIPTTSRSSSIKQSDPRRKESRSDDEGTKRSIQAVGYEWVDISEDGDMETTPPLSIYSVASSEESARELIPLVVGDRSMIDTAVIVVLDWTKPHLMMEELIKWLSWVDKWTSSSSSTHQIEEGHDRLQSFIQHYVEPTTTTDGQSTQTNSFSASTYGVGGEPLPLGDGVLTHNKAGVPIIIVCTKSDLIDSIGDQLSSRGLLAGKSSGSGERAWIWDERVDWVQQMLRCVAMKYGASLFYTSQIRLETYTNLRSYILHRLYTIPPPLHPEESTSQTPTSSITKQPRVLPSGTGSRFTFPFRANVIDRNAVMVPTGWDSWGKINVLRDGFEPGKVGESWDVSLERLGPRREEGVVMDEEEKGIEEIWCGVVPDLEEGMRIENPHEKITQVEPEQEFLSRQLDILMRDPHRDPRKAFRSASGQSSSRVVDDGSLSSRGVGVVGPLAGAGLSMPSVEMAMREMEGGQEQAAKRPSGRDVTSPTGEGSSAEVLSNFFQGLIAGRRAPATFTPAAK